MFRNYTGVDVDSSEGYLLLLSCSNVSNVVFFTFHLNLKLLFLQSKDPGDGVREDPAEVGEAGALQDDTGVVGGPHHQQLQELDGVDAGHYLGHQLGHDHHHHAGEQAGLQEDCLDPGGDVEEESILRPAVYGGQLGREEDRADDEDLSAHQELLDVVSSAGDLAQLVSRGVGVLVELRVESLQLDESYLEPLHDPQAPEDKDEYEEAGPARHLLPHACLLLQDGVAGHHPGEYQQTCPRGSHKM